MPTNKADGADRDVFQAVGRGCSRAAHPPTPLTAEMNRDSETPIIFLAMFWGGGGRYTLPDIVGVYDWVNRAIPSRTEMQTALNTLLAMGLIKQKDDTFLIPKRQHAAFDTFRKKKRKDRFDTVRMYFRQLPEVAHIPEVVKLTESEYKAHLKAYHKAFREATKRS
jgi:hypothetical protein